MTEKDNGSVSFVVVKQFDSQMLCPSCGKAGVYLEFVKGITHLTCSDCGCKGTGYDTEGAYQNMIRNAPVYYLADKLDILSNVIRRSKQSCSR